MRATLIREPLDCELAPVSAALALRGEQYACALIGAWAGGGAILAAAPVRVAGPREDLFAVLDEQPRLKPGPTPDGAIGGGWFGHLGFGLGRHVEALDPSPPAPAPLPDGVLAFYDHVVRCDAAGRWWFEALVMPGREAAVAAGRDAWVGRLREVRPACAFGTDGWSWTPSARGHAAAVQACRERIAAGDLFQANICQRLEGRLDGDPLDVFAAAAQALATDRAAYVAGPWGALVSLSPELYLSRRGAAVLSAPIKGTRPAGARAELEASGKDRAENVMIVDLVRNDLGRVCRPGSIAVRALAQARRHAGVWHLVSEVTGTLRDGVGDGELLRATFPPGSVTGAPKIAALNVISELESTRRETYTGAIGFVSPAARLELSVAIRTFEISGERIWLGVGGGIVADSVPAQEAAEARAKAAPLLAAIGAELPPGADTAPAVESVPAIARRGPRPLPRPDPRAGLYETIRIAGGVAQQLDAHLARLAASWADLYDLALPGALAARAVAAAGGRAEGRLRIDAVPGREPVFTVTALPVSEPPVLRPVVLPGGLGAHKWRDRRLLEALEAEDRATLPLLIDADGYVLETSRTAVVVRDADGQLYGPPADGRILPSVTAAVAGVQARVLALDDLQHAGEIFVASALRGLQPATLITRWRRRPSPPSGAAAGPRTPAAR